MSDEEDDLELLRSAALASLGQKPPRDHHNDGDDLETLRKMALTSRKNQHEKEAAIYEKLQPLKSSNLINLTPNPTKQASGGESESDNEELSSDSSYRDDPSESEEDSSSDDDVSDSSDSQENRTESTVLESDKRNQNNEEDDLLSAIDQFLDEGVMMLEQVTDAPKPNEAKKKKTSKEPKKSIKKAETKKKKLDTDKKKLKNSKTSLTTKQKLENAERSTSKLEARKKMSEGSKKSNNSATKKRQLIDVQETKQAKSAQPLWSSNDIPLNTKAKKEEGSDSVHSSDLSFLSNSDNEEVNEDAAKSFPETNHVDSRSKSERKFIRINRHKLNELERENAEKHRVSGGDSLGPDPRASSTVQRPARPSKALPDLRDKLKQRGFQRRKMDKNSDEIRKKDENGTKNVPPKKIYVKPSVVYNSNSTRNPPSKAKIDLSGAQTERLIVTRKVIKDVYSPLEVTIADDTKEQDVKRFRRKRSVVQFKPEESASEKRERLALIKKQAQETLEAERISDLEEDFDDFEIEEPREHWTEEKVEKTIEKSPSTTKSNSHGRPHGSSSVRANQQLRAESPLSDYDEEADEEPGEIKSSPRRKSSLTLSEDEDYAVQSKINELKDVKTDNRRRKRQITSHIIKPFVIQERGLSRRREENSRKKRRRDDYGEDDRLPLLPEEDTLNRRKRKMNVVEAGESASKASVKQRLGLNRAELDTDSLQRRGREEFTRNTADRGRNVASQRRTAGRERNIDAQRKPTSRERNVVPRRKSADRERDVDARIRRINEQNAKIIRRKQMIEEEEKQFRSKPS